MGVDVIHNYAIVSLVSTIIAGSYVHTNVVIYIS